MKNDRIRNPFWALVFLGYGAFMLYLLFFKDRTAMEGVPYWQQVKNNYNMELWHTIGNFWDILVRPEYYMEKWGAVAIYRANAQIAFVNLVGNVVMFVPFGAFLPAMWPKLQKAWKAIPVGGLCILAVELLQLFTLLGKCDVDDVLLNMIGMIAGYALWRLCKTARKGKREKGGT